MGKGDKYLNWPIRFGWEGRFKSRWFTTHGWQIGWDVNRKRIFGWTLHFGALKVLFGPKGGR